MEKPQTQTRNRKKRLTQGQISVLEKSFVMNKKLEPELKHQLASQLGLPPRQVAVWFQNKRARCKTQTLELQHGAIMEKLEAALADKRRLEREVKFLQEELRKSRDQLSRPMTKNGHLDHRTASPVDDSNCSGDCFAGNDHQVMGLDELYACLITSGHGSTSASWI
ncbi:PREDICTED: homeobox-leucine zipper protein ATHB-52 [Tarenaya hassleriana]|uniref:homeobox-leucine zipper protein ATHB-52 n=1 Tax=Tarenaya hassleriana TaxID=28532 RepID=UPI00053C1BA4|nr:PREDICTED: homeobox-leucine zipper protein ATHB-52 [Tarenaya hassleriana]